MRYVIALASLLLASLPLHAASWQPGPASWPKAFTDAGLHGTMLVYDEQTDRWLVHDEARARRGFLPASTFKLFNALVALDTGAVQDEYDVIRWDGKDRSVFGKAMPMWNRDNSLASGMRYSTIWFYQEVARRAGAKRMQAYLNSANYGNRDISAGIDRFWIEGGMRISAEQQVAFLRGLADGSLPFTERAQEAVRRISVLEDGKHYTLHGKTGYGDKTAPDGHDVGWFVGWSEYRGQRWFFALNADMVDQTDAAKRVVLTKALLVAIDALPASDR